MLAGGPGQNAAQMRRGYARHWARKERDIVLVSQRGTAVDNNLLCPQAASEENLQGYLEPFFLIEGLKRCREALVQKFDLTRYSTFEAAEDLNEVRRALGYDKINLNGGSYGTRVALIYMRQYAETVRTAILNGLAPLAFKNPLYHAWGGQQALEKLFVQCEEDSACHEAYPNMEEEFWTVIEKLDKEHPEVKIPHPVTREMVPVLLTRDAFAESIRAMMYSQRQAERIPHMIHQAFLGHYRSFVESAVYTNRAIIDQLSIGLLMCVTCSEDIPFITSEEIVRETEGTFLGDVRVKDQIEACEFWPKTDLPQDNRQPVRVAVPVLLLSGTRDPVTPPRWGAEVHKNLARSIHVVYPGAHGVGGSCIRGITKRFLDAGSEKDLDISCSQIEKPQTFYIPGKK
jgi:pimeloyl-ACP methyl ester carboxylesterase